MKRTGFSNKGDWKGFKKPTKGLRRAKFGVIKPKVRITKPKRELMPNRVKRAKKELVELSHTFIRKRDGINGEIKGYCFDCGAYAEGQHFECGHFKSDSTGGALLRYHPHNMHGQASGCNMAFSQERVKIDYTLKMLEKYGLEYVNKLRNMKPNMQFKADILFYENMIVLYKYGNEENIVKYLESLTV